MSRIGRKPIDIPNGVTIEINGNIVMVKGPKGELSQRIPDDMEVEILDGVLNVKRPSDSKLHRSMHGLTRTLIHNMVVGVTEQFRKTLEINGVGYRAAKQGTKLQLNVGKSHPVAYDETADIKIEVPDPNHIIIIGCDKQKVGAFAANIRAERPVEPYKGKGLKYEGEHVIRKVGKTGKK